MLASMAPASRLSGPTVMNRLVKSSRCSQQRHLVTMSSVPACYRPRYLNIQRLNYLWTIRHSLARIAGNPIT
jgi:hypothetical protein